MVKKYTIPGTVLSFLLLIPLLAHAKDLTPTDQSIQVPTKQVTPETAKEAPPPVSPKPAITPDTTTQKEKLKAPALQKAPVPAIPPQKKEAISSLTVERVQVKSLKEVTGGEEALVILTGKNLDRVTAAEARGAQVRVLKKTPTLLRLKLTGKGAALKQAAVKVTLRAGTEFKEVPLGKEIARARQAAAKPEIDMWREDIEKRKATKEAGRTLEMERAQDTARPLETDEITSPGLAAPAQDMKVEEERIESPGLMTDQPIPVQRREDAVSGTRGSRLDTRDASSPRGTITGPTERYASLAITGWEPGRDEPVQLGEHLTGNVRLRNTSQIAGTVMVAALTTTTAGAVRSVPVLIPPMSMSDPIPLRIPIERNMIEGDRVKTTLYLVDSSWRPWADGSPDDNTREISHPFIATLYTVWIYFDHIDVIYDGDRGSDNPGEWEMLLFGGVACGSIPEGFRLRGSGGGHPPICGGTVERCSRVTSQNIDEMEVYSGRSHRIGLSVELRSVTTEQNIEVCLGGRESDFELFTYAKKAFAARQFTPDEWRRGGRFTDSDPDAVLHYSIRALPQRGPD